MKNGMDVRGFEDSENSEGSEARSSVSVSV